MKFKFILTAIFLFVLTEIGFSQQHGADYLSVPKQKILSAFGKPNKITRANGIDQWQYTFYGSADTDKPTSTTYGIQYGRCVYVVTLWNFTSKQKAQSIFNYLVNEFRPYFSVVKDDTFEKIYANEDIIITLSFKHWNTYMVISKIDERQQ